MSGKTVLLEVLLSGFFAVACIRARAVSLGESITLGSFVHLTGRLERLRRSRWQWFCMVALLLVLRFQQMQVFTLELIVAVEFLIFMALPTQTAARARGLAR